MSEKPMREEIKEEMKEELREERAEEKAEEAIQDGEDQLIDPEVKEELEENFPEDPYLTEYAPTGGNSEDSEKVDVTSEWIEGDDWRGKTKLSAEQIIAMTQVRLMPEVFDELEEINPYLKSVVESLERYAVSHQGWSREQHVEVLSSMHSGESVGNDDARNMFMEAFAQPEQDDE